MNTSPTILTGQTDLSQSSLAQLTTAWLFSVALPFLVFSGQLPMGVEDTQAQNAALASTAGLLLGFWLNRGVSALPGTRESSSILPSYLISFGLVLLAILFFRVNYSRLLLFFGFSVSVFWFYIVYLVTNRRRELKLGIVEGGRTETFASLGSVKTIPLTLTDNVSDLDGVVADLRHDHSGEWEERLADYVLAGTMVYHSKDLLESLTGRADLEHLSENNLGSLSPLSTFLLAKRIIDRVIAVPALVAVSPILLVTAIAIRLTSSGPVFFQQRRVGFRGVAFKVIKFRTMTSANSEKGSRDDFITQANDSRITKLGAFLRRSRIDELPQIINILRGEMSWIGPRPEAAKLSEWYEQEIPFYRYRHVVVPGITGWAQVTQGHVADIDSVRAKLQYDFYYIRNFSLWLDLLIITKTVKTMLTGFGAR